MIYAIFLVWTNDVNLINWSKELIRNKLPINSVKHRNKLEITSELITKLKQDSFWSITNFKQGDWRSYRNLLRALEENNDELKKDQLISAINEIQQSYGQVDVLRQHIEPIRNPHSWWICKESVPACNTGFEEPKGFKAQNLINHLSRTLWPERARAASMLRNIDTAPDKNKIDREQLFSKLMDRLDPEKEESLYVAKLAFETYKHLANFSEKETFGFKKAIKDWENRKHEILKKSF